MANLSKLLETAEAAILIRLNELKKRNIVIGGKRTSVTLEPLVWEILHEIANEQDCTIHDLCTFIHERKGDNSSMSSAIRVFLISYLYINYKKKG